jgi:hypothetical protein
MKSKKTIISLVAVLILILVFIFYKEGILFGTNGNNEYSDSIKKTADSIKGTEVPVGNPPVESNITDTSKQGSSETGTKPDGTVDIKKLKEKPIDTVKKTVPVGKPPEDEKNNPGQEGGNQTPAEKDKSK